MVCHFAVVHPLQRLQSDLPSKSWYFDRLIGQGPRCWWKSRQLAAVALGSDAGADGCFPKCQQENMGKKQ